MYIVYKHSPRPDAVTVRARKFRTYNNKEVAQKVLNAQYVKWGIPNENPIILSMHFNKAAAVAAKKKYNMGFVAPTVTAIEESIEEQPVQTVEDVLVNVPSREEREAIALERMQNYIKNAREVE